MNISIHKPVSALHGTIHLPGSKSISNRILMIKALGALDFEVCNLSGSDDTRYLQEALHTIQENHSGSIDIGHAGTDMRFLAGCLALQKGEFELTGSDRMQQRPIGDLVEVLNGLGADIRYKNKKGFPPLLIKGKKLNGGKAIIKGNISSQFISSLLLVAPYFTNGLELSITDEMVSVPYIKMTIELMKEFGAQLEWNENTITVQSVPYSYAGNLYAIESDWSAASYYFSAVALSEPNTSLTLKGLFKNSLQADAVCAGIYDALGVRTAYSKNEITVTKVGSISKETFEYNFINCPDIAQTLACTCIGLKKPFYFTGLQTLKVKETDRITALKNEMEKLGFKIGVTDSAMSFEDRISSSATRNNVISTYHDHRMAMSFAPLGLVFDHLVVEDPEVVSKSYPGFWNDLSSIGFILTEH